MRPQEQYSPRTRPESDFAKGLVIPPVNQPACEGAEDYANQAPLAKPNTEAAATRRPKPRLLALADTPRARSTNHRLSPPLCVHSTANSPPSSLKFPSRPLL